MHTRVDHVKRSTIFYEGSYVARDSTYRVSRIPVDRNLHLRYTSPVNVRLKFGKVATPIDFSRIGEVETFRTFLYNTIETSTDYLSCPWKIIISSLNVHVCHRSLNFRSPYRSRRFFPTSCEGLIHALNLVYRGC